MSISAGQVKGNPKEAAELIVLLEAENERLRARAEKAEQLINDGAPQAAIYALHGEYDHQQRVEPSK